MAFARWFEFCRVPQQASDSFEVPVAHAAWNCASHCTGNEICCEAISSGCEACGVRKLCESDVLRAMADAALSVRPWCEGGFGMVKKIQDAHGNYGRVDQMKLGDRNVAVKQMPNHWVADTVQDFDQRNPDAAERPWRDLGLIWELNRMQFKYSCELLGIFRDENSTYVVTSLATQGDLFSWRATEPRPGREREALMHPIMHQTFEAVKMLHDLGIAHRDLSMENILLTEDAHGGTQVKIIDFAMSTLSRRCRSEERGKVVYRAPEIYLSTEYDAFLADTFALGVVVFAVASRDYPWSCTRKTCQSFRYVSEHGFVAFLEQRKVRNGSAETLSEVFSAPLIELLDGMLAIDPCRRMSLGELASQRQCEACIGSVWEMPWLSGPVEYRERMRKL